MCAFRILLVATVVAFAVIGVAHTVGVFYDDDYREAMRSVRLKKLGLH